MQKFLRGNKKWDYSLRPKWKLVGGEMERVGMRGKEEDDGDDDERRRRWEKKEDKEESRMQFIIMRMIFYSK